MRIAVLSDTHADASRSEQVLLRLKNHVQGADLILHAGDITSVELLKGLCSLSTVEAVRGNMDSVEIRSTLPETKILTIAGRRIGLIHGWGAPDDLPRRVYEKFLGEDKKPTVDAIVFGHSHRAMVERRDGVLLVNPGSPTDARFAPYVSLAHLEIGGQIEAKITRL
jgi:uncharacterized protein